MSWPVPPSRFATVLRDETDPQWQAAFDWLVRLMAGLIGRYRQWPRVVAVTSRGDDPAEVAHHLAVDFYLHLRTNESTLRHGHVTFAALVNREIVKFLRTRPQGATMVQHGETYLREELLTQLRRILRVERFPWIPWGRGRLYGTHEIPQRPMEEADVARVLEEQPRVVADWYVPGPMGVSRRSESLRVPAPVKRAVLLLHLQAVFRIARSYASAYQLRDFCWAAFDPPASALLGTWVDAAEGTAGELTASPDEGIEREFALPAALEEFLRSRDPEELHLVKQHYGEGRSVIGLAVGTSRATVYRKIGAFERALFEFLQARGYGEPTPLLTKAMRDMVASWALPDEGGGERG